MIKLFFKNIKERLFKVLNKIHYFEEICQCGHEKKNHIMETGCCWQCSCGKYKIVDSSGQWVDILKIFFIISFVVLIFVLLFLIAIFFIEEKTSDKLFIIGEVVDKYENFHQTSRDSYPCGFRGRSRCRQPLAGYTTYHIAVSTEKFNHTFSNLDYYNLVNIGNYVCLTYEVVYKKPRFYYSEFKFSEYRVIDYKFFQEEPIDCH